MKTTPRYGNSSASLQLYALMFTLTLLSCCGTKTQQDGSTQIPPSTPQVVSIDTSGIGSVSLQAASVSYAQADISSILVDVSYAKEQLATAVALTNFSGTLWNGVISLPPGIPLTVTVHLYDAGNREIFSRVLTSSFSNTSSPPLVLTSSDEYTTSVTPTIVQPGIRNDITVSFTLKRAMALKGGLQVRLPNGFAGYQFTDPTANKYVYANSDSATGSVAVKSITAYDVSDPWDDDTFSQTIGVLVTQGQLVSGDTIRVIFPNTYIQSIAMKEVIRMAHDFTGAGSYVPVTAPPVFRIAPATAWNFAAYLPSRVETGTQTILKISAFDYFNNHADAYTGTLTLQSSDPLATIPSQAVMNASHRGYLEIPFVFQTPGVHRISISATSMVNNTVDSNPAVVSATPVDRFIYWGDTHSHSGYSHDGRGTGMFTYARYATALDFFATTEHLANGSGTLQGINQAEWEQIKRDVVRYNDPGRFVTIPGYEISFASPTGHHNVFYNVPDAMVPSLALLSNPYAVADLFALNAVMGDISYFTVPHHTGKRLGGVSTMVSFGPAYGNNLLRPAIEIYSLHGLSESYDPAHSLSYNNVFTFTDRVMDGPYYAQDAWAAGEVLGVIGGSDNHEAQPGKNYAGLTAVSATALTRDAIFQAIRERRTYATTGDRIIMEFTVDGHPMGSCVPSSVTSQPVVTLSVHATAPLLKVEVLRYDGAYAAGGHPDFQVIASYSSASRSMTQVFSDTGYSGKGIYYLRVQEDLQRRNQVDYSTRYRNVHGWTSPVWLNYPCPATP